MQPQMSPLFLDSYFQVQSSKSGLSREEKKKGIHRSRGGRLSGKSSEGGETEAHTTQGSDHTKISTPGSLWDPALVPSDDRSLEKKMSGVLAIQYAWSSLLRGSLQAEGTQGWRRMVGFRTAL